MPYTLKNGRQNQDQYINQILWCFEKYPESIDALLELVGRDPNNLFSKLANTIKTTGDLNYTLSRIIWSLFYRTRRYTFGEKLIGAILDTQHKVRKENNTPDLLSGALFGIITHCDYKIVEQAEQILECVKLEFYTVHLRRYEDEKINTSENGDVNYEWPKRTEK